ncbi:MAG: immunoglobulin domain-containing protein, partial [Formivibrio sp.]|nr:immunoglobulin domain-containing protein [Formivibrio sp.]
MKQNDTAVITTIPRRLLWLICRSALILLSALCGVSVQGAGLQMLHGHSAPLLKSLVPTSVLPATNRLNLAISLPLRNAAALSNLLHEIYDPTSARYHHYLTTAEFTEKFGPTERDYRAVIDFAEANHMQVVTTHPNRVLLDVRSSVADAEKTLHLTMCDYQHPIEKRQFYAPDREPSVDLAVPILQISGLDNYSLPRPHLRVARLANGQNSSPNAGSGPSGSYIGTDFRKAYVPDTVLNGSGQVVGLLQFDGYTASDITYYESKAGLPNVPLQNVLLDGFSGNPTFNGGEVEVSLDIEMAISMATNLSKVVVYEAGPTGNWHDLLNRMANDNMAKQLSSSWYLSGGGADATADQIFQQMAAQGQSFFNASGDNDAYPGLIDFPGDSPFITQVGGTTLSTSVNGAWVGETVWNWGVERGSLYDGQGSGGGVSTQYPIPTWQTNISMAANQGSLTSRNTPDVAMIADNIYVRADGTDLIEGGTSCASPLWAGFAALVNQQATNLSQPSIGFVNPALAAVGASPHYTAAFHDITTGNNTWSNSPSKFYAVAGYDLCTGWGTPAGQKLIDFLANPEPLLVTPGNGFTAIGGVSGPFTVSSQGFSLTDVGTNPLTWTVSNAASWLNVLPSGGTLTPGGPAVTVTASLNNAASNLDVGTYTATLWFTNVNDGIGQSRQIVLSVISPPTITQQPTNQTVLEGESAGFRVQATGGLPLAYQWQLSGTNLADGGNILGSSTTNLTIGKVSAANVGPYTVVVTNFAGMVTSSIAALTITSSPPVIVLQPTNQAVYIGMPVSFSVGAIGTVPFYYQWSFNGTNIVNATNATLTLVSVQLTNAGNYSVVVTNLYGSTNSATAVLSVSAGSACDPVPSGIVAWWQAENNALDSVGTNNGVPIGGITYTSGKVGQAFSLDGSSTYISVPVSPSLNIGSAGLGFTIEGWINPGALTIQYTAPIIEWDSDSAIGVHFWASDSLYANIISTDGNSHIMQSAGGLITSGVLQHVALTYDQTSGTGVLYCNGTAVLMQNLGGFVPQTTYPLNIGRRTGNVVGSGYNFQGLIDELSLYRRALSSNEIAAIYLVGSGGKCFAPTPPVITTQPTNQAVAVGGTAVFVVTASGTPPLFYQWSFNGTNVVNGTNATLTMTSVQINQSGNYSVLVTNLYGLTNSGTAVLTVYGVPPVITTQPTNQTVFVGSTVVFNVTASGTAPLFYQWSFNGTNIVNGTNATLTLTNVQFTNAGNYSVLVANLYGSTNSAIAVLTVNGLPSCDPVPSGVAAWWRAEGNAVDIINGNNGTLVGNVGFVPGEVGQAFSLDGSSTYISVPASPSSDIGSVGTGVTIEAWIDPAGLTIQYGAPVVEWDSSTAIGLHFWASDSLFANVIGTDGNPHTIQSGGGLITQGVFQHVAFTYDRASGTAILYCNGSAVTTQNLGSIVPQTTYPLNIGRRTGNVTGSGYNFDGLIDEPTIYSRALSSNEIAAIYLAGSGGKCFTPTPPVITTQPTNQTVAVGGT